MCNLLFNCLYIIHSPNADGVHKFGVSIPLRLPLLTSAFTSWLTGAFDLFVWLMFRECCTHENSSDPLNWKHFVTQCDLVRLSQSDLIIGHLISTARSFPLNGLRGGFLRGR